ncbi:MAG: site-specific DNA-methyltransferase [Candidatus Omnitrophica bacterium]|nr:site-specific DNA-methyltransferase [Candidatus Omnitrophota bacterium]
MERIKSADARLEGRFASKLQVNRDLKRTLVSFQANKSEPGFRWFKYKEGFSSALVDYAFDRCGVTSGKIIDPFAGSGAALFVASRRGLDSVGVELLPVGCEFIRARREAIAHRAEVIAALRKWRASNYWIDSKQAGVLFPHLAITQGAFPPRNEALLGKYLRAVANLRSEAVKTVLRAAALAVLEEISFTRKDGQYLRWDYRSGRRQGEKPFNKGTIKDFDMAIREKLAQFIEDLDGPPALFDATSRTRRGKIQVLRGSCLERLPKLSINSFDALMTSPPYCNRYDYTRTYALELALLGVSEESLRTLRQRMVSCTVENREKQNLGAFFSTETFEKAKVVFQSQELLNYIVDYLEALKIEDQLNNNGIPRMVKNYFWELTLTLIECQRVLKPGAPFIMVNDDVRYAGISIPVDLILSRIAEEVGFEVEKIWVLPAGKGNSSQQMGEHGREELRKCVYIWRVLK